MHTAMGMEVNHCLSVCARLCAHVHVCAGPAQNTYAESGGALLINGINTAVLIHSLALGLRCLPVSQADIHSLTCSKKKGREGRAVA